MPPLFWDVRVWIFIIVLIVILKKWRIKNIQSPIIEEVVEIEKGPKKFKSKFESRVWEALSWIVKKFGGNLSYLRYNIRPPFLINPETGKRMEYDFFYDDGKIICPLAVEAQGEQHYKYPNKFHPKGKEGREAFEAQCRRDYYKLYISTKNKILLIRVPFSVGEGGDERTKIENIKQYILQKLHQSLIVS